MLICLNRFVFVWKLIDNNGSIEQLVFVRNFLISGTITEDCISLFSKNSIYIYIYGIFSSQRHKDYGARKSPSQHNRFQLNSGRYLIISL